MVRYVALGQRPDAGSAVNFSDRELPPSLSTKNWQLYLDCLIDRHRCTPLPARDDLPRLYHPETNGRFTICLDHALRILF